jgi:hypothetical protein
MQFILQLDRPLIPYLSLEHLSAQHVMKVAKKPTVYFFRSTFLARRVLHLVILFNAAIDRHAGPIESREWSTLISLSASDRLWPHQLMRSQLDS